MPAYDPMANESIAKLTRVKENLARGERADSQSEIHDAEKTADDAI